MRRPRSSVAGFWVAVITIAALVPGLVALDGALFEPLWRLLPDAAPVVLRVPIVRCGEQTAPLCSVLSSRGPPSFLLA